MNHTQQEILTAISKEKERALITIDLDFQWQGRTYAFENRNLQQLCIELRLPKDYTQMKEDAAARKFLSQSRPEVILSSPDTTSCFGFSVAAHHVNEQELVDELTAIKAAIKSMQPAALFYECQVLPVEEKNIGYLDYLGYAMDGKLYNVIFILPMGGNMLLGSFSCPEEERDLWKLLMPQVLQSVRVLEDEEEELCRQS